MFFKFFKQHNDQPMQKELPPRTKSPIFIINAFLDDRSKCMFSTYLKSVVLHSLYLYSNSIAKDIFLVTYEEYT
jgi:hypothetical protein